MILNKTPEEYPDLTAQDFLYVYRLNYRSGSIYSFQAQSSGRKIASLESCHLGIKEWSRKFFFVSRPDWEYLKGEAAHKSISFRRVGDSPLPQRV